ncbi:MAG TPA: NAD(P)H-binding protein [Chitinispirillaceae bacterium]|nr:NAD(P)H-binding protein [Chitinispirillaceae bacterium]
MCVIDAVDSIGYFTSKRLALSGFEVVAISTDESRLSRLFGHPNIQICLIKNYSTKELAPLLNNVQSCCVNKAGWKQQTGFIKNVLDAAKEAQVSHIVAVADIGNDAAEFKPLEAQQSELEYHIANANIGWTMLYHNFLMQYLLLCINSNTVSMCFPAADKKVSFVDARDVAIAAAEIMISGFHFHGMRYVITGPSSYSLKQCTEIISEITGVRIDSRIECNEDVFKSSASERGMDPELVKYIVHWSAFASGGGAAGVKDNVETISGIEPGTFEDFVRDHADQIRYVLAQGKLPDDMLYAQ